MKPRLVLAALLLVAVPLSLAEAGTLKNGGQTPIVPSSGEEFVGPFASWMCARSSVSGTCGAAAAAFFNADGGGSVDDTAALQSALDHIGTSSSCAAGSGCNPVLYVPCGSYKITGQLYLLSQSGVAIFGQDNTTSGGRCTTSLLWYGPSPSTNQATFTGVISGVVVGGSGGYTGTLTVSGLSGTIQPGHVLTSGVTTAPNTKLYVFASTGGNTWLVGSQQSFSGSGAMTSAYTGMFFGSGITTSQISRLTFDGRSIANTALVSDWAGINNYFPTGNQYADDVFQNTMLEAFSCGQTAGCSEVSLTRDKFLNNVTAVAVHNSNADNIWLWYSDVENNTNGLTNNNNVAAGNFSAISNVFKNNSNKDIQWGNLSGSHAILYNYSSGSGSFINGGGANAFDSTAIVGNSILNTGLAVSVNQNTLGPMLFAGNTVVTSPTATSVSIGGSFTATAAAGPYILSGQNTSWGDILSYGNTFTAGSVANPCLLSPAPSPAFASTRCHEFSDVINPAASPVQPTLPPVPPNLGRTVFDASTSTLQATICLAATGSSGFSSGNCTGTVSPSRNVVHMPAGSYSGCYVVPANADIQIVGDGNATQLQCGTPSTPTLKLTGPSYVVLRDFTLAGSVANSIDGIEISNSDQAGAVIWSSRYNSGTNTASVYADSLSNAMIEMHDSSLGGATTGILANGSNKIRYFMGVSTTQNSGPVLAASNAADVVVLGNWNDVGNVTSLTITGSGPLTWTSSLTGGSAITQLSMSSYTGTALIGPEEWGVGQTSAVLNIGTSSGAKVLGEGIGAWNTTFWNPTGAGTVEFLNGFNSNTGALVTETSANGTFVGQALAQLLATVPTLPPSASTGPTGVSLYEIHSGNARYGLHVH
jgi:hypothetical protein